MRMWRLGLALAVSVGFDAGALASAQTPGVQYPDSLRTEWSVVSTRAGRARVVADVLSLDRGLFDVPVPEATASYRVSVEAVDWVKECR
jgi:hypothetical protein